MPIQLKICCIASLAEAALAIEAGAHAIGLVAAMPSGPGVIPESLIAQIAAAVPPHIFTFLLTSLTSAEDIVAQAGRCGTNTVQICDAVPAGVHGAIRAALPRLRIVQVIHVAGEDSIAEALSAAQTAGALLLDSGNPAAAIKQLGGTGRTHNWRISRQIVERAPVPVYLAGGLTPENAAEAIDAVGPFGLDICTGVRTDGHLDAAKVRALAAAMGYP